MKRRRSQEDPVSLDGLQRRGWPWLAWAIAWLLAGSLLTGEAQASEPTGLPSPLGLDAALAVARERRAEITAARARARAAEQEPGIVYPLEDPMIAPTINHLPFRLHGIDASVMVEQRLPLSRLRRHRRDAARATSDRVFAGVSQATLDVELAAAAAFFMLWERREMADIVDQQLELSVELIAAAEARYAAAMGPQADVLRAELEGARLAMQRRVLGAEIDAAEAMLRATLGCPPEISVPELTTWSPPAPAPSSAVVVAAASEGRPELKGGRAEIRAAEADVQAMRSMYAPMAMLRAGPAYTMTGGMGAMLMFGISVPRRHRVRAQVQQAEAMESMARSDLSAMQRMIEGEAANAHALVRAANIRVSALRDDVIPRAEQAISPTIAGYAAGQLPLVSVIEVARALWIVQAELVAAQMDLGVAWAELRRATGKGRS